MLSFWIVATMALNTLPPRSQPPISNHRTMEIVNPSSLPLPTSSSNFWSELGKTPKATKQFLLALLVVAGVVCAVLWWVFYLHNR